MPTRPFDPTTSRRAFLQATLAASAAALAACDSVRPIGPAAPAADAGTTPDTPLPAADATPTCAPATVPMPADGHLDVAAAQLPFRQHDPAWGGDLMWDRKLVIQAATQFNGETQADAEALLREFPDGNNLANEGCQVTVMAMVLRLLHGEAKPAWTPKILNEVAHAYYFYTPCGLSMTTLYADLVSDVSSGLVQLCVKEEYLPGEAGWSKVSAATSPLVRAYRRLPPQKRSQFVLMLKTGTWDDTVASHFVLLHPHDEGGPDDANPLVLDPAMPLDKQGPWRLTDSAAAILQDADIAEAWKARQIEPTQLGGVWVFASVQPGQARPAHAALVSQWAMELAAAST